MLTRRAVSEARPCERTKIRNTSSTHILSNIEFVGEWGAHGDALYVERTRLCVRQQLELLRTFVLQPSRIYSMRNIFLMMLSLLASSRLGCPFSSSLGFLRRAAMPIAPRMTSAERELARDMRTRIHMVCCEPRVV